MIIRTFAPNDPGEQTGVFRSRLAQDRALLPSFIESNGTTLLSIEADSGTINGEVCKFVKAGLPDWKPIPGECDCIDLFSEPPSPPADAAANEARTAVVNALAKLEFIGQATAEVLFDAELRSSEDLTRDRLQELLKQSDVSPQIKRALQKYIDKHLT